MYGIIHLHIKTLTDDTVTYVFIIANVRTDFQYRKKGISHPLCKAHTG